MLADLGYPGVDIRGRGSLLVVAPSADNEGSYKVMNDVPFADLPKCLEELLDNAGLIDKPEMYDDKPAPVSKSPLREDLFPPCVKQWEQVIRAGPNHGRKNPDGLFHDERVSHAAFLKCAGASEEQIVEKYATVPDYDRKITEYQVRSVFKGDLRCMKCSTMKKRGYCPIEGSCSAASPIYAYIDALGHNGKNCAPLEQVNIVSKANQPTIVKVVDDADGILEIEDLNELLGSYDADPGWLIKDWWTRRSHGIVAGIPKSGKSILTTDAAVSVASGMKFLGRYEVMEKGPVLIIQNENARWVMKARIQQIIAAKGLGGSIDEKDGKFEIEFPPELPIFTVNNKAFKLDDSEGRKRFEATVRKYQPVLVILDPFYLMFSGDSTKADQVIPHLRYLLDFKNQMNKEGHGFALILVHHYNKGSDGRSGAVQTGGQRIHGTTFFHGWLESAWYITKGGKKDDDLSKDDDDEDVDLDYRGPLKITREFRAGDNGRLGPVMVKTNIDEMSENGKYTVRVWDEAAGDIQMYTRDEVKEMLLQLIPMVKANQADVIKDFVATHGEVTSDKTLKRIIGELAKDEKIHREKVNKRRTDIWKN
jgi:hypothetical protein